MADAYSNVKVGKLVLKGEKNKKNKKRKKDKDGAPNEGTKRKKLNVDEDAEEHGGWWEAKRTAEVIGPVAIEFEDHRYVKALDNGLFALGAPHSPGEGPCAEEILTAFPINDIKVSLKSGYGKYLRVEKDNTISGRSEAVGSMEQFEPIFQEQRMALLTEAGLFMSIDPEDDAIVALSKKVGPNEICKIRCNSERKQNKEEEKPKEDKGDLAEVEKNYVKKFQKFQDKKMRVNKGDVQELEDAKKKGSLHETLLDRRSKMKADRYCK